MALINELQTSKGNVHVGIVPSGSSGAWTFRVSPGRKITINIGNPNGDTFDLIYFTQTEEDEVETGTTRVMAVDTSGITDVSFNAASLNGMAEVGINLGAASTADIQVEVIESKL